MVLVRSLSLGLLLAFVACACSSAGSSDEPNTTGSFVPAVDAGAVSCGDITCMDGNVCVDQVTVGGAVGTPPRHSYSCATPASSCHGVPDCACMEALCETLSCVPWNAPGKMCCIGMTGKTVQCVIQTG